MTEKDAQKQRLLDEIAGMFDDVKYPGNDNLFEGINIDDEELEEVFKELQSIPFFQDLTP